MSEAAAPSPAPNGILATLRSRRMVRAMVDRPIERPQLKQVLEAARWAPNAGNRHLHRFVVVQVPAPDDAVVICIDQARAVDFGMRANLKGLYVDVGTAAQTMR